MDKLFLVLPFIVSFVVLITKKRIVNAKSGRKFALREMFLDLLKILLIAMIAMIANFVYGKRINIGNLIIDVFMLIPYLLLLMQKNYDYSQRKALMGILAFFIFLVTICVSIFLMLVGIYDQNDTTLGFIFIKGVSYFFISIWCCFTYEKEKKIKGHVCELKESICMYRISTLDFYAFAFLGLFIFIGGNGYITPFCIFGIHEILNKKAKKGILYIIFGNIFLVLQYIQPFWASILILLYIAVALIDLLIQFIKSKKLLHKYYLF